MTEYETVSGLSGKQDASRSASPRSGDWLISGRTPHSQNTPVPIVATCIYYYDLKVMKETAELLGKRRCCGIRSAYGAGIPGI
ncbi:MAG: hypothetical protein ACLUOI_12590 [Eisenbergiella sp.]